MAHLWTDSRGLVLANAETNLTRNCLCCPCTEWEIGTICWAGMDCGEDFSIECKRDITISGNETRLNLPRGIEIGDIIWKKTWVAPVGSTADATINLYRNGTLLDGPYDIELVANTEYVHTYEYGGVLTDNETRFDMVAVITPKGPPPAVNEVVTEKGYTCVAIFTFPTAIKGDVVVVPSTPVGCFSNELQYNKMLGPYRSKADADYVRLTWSDLIEEYAKNCVCLDADCTNDLTLSAEAIEDIDGTLHLAYYAAGTIAAGYYCATGWATFTAAYDKAKADEFGYTITPVFIYPDGTVVPISWVAPVAPSIDPTCSGNIPQCVGLAFQISGVQADFEFDGYSPIFGQVLLQNNPDICFQENPESPFYGDEWDYTPWSNPNPPTGVPHTSDDLADYLAYLETIT